MAADPIWAAPAAGDGGGTEEVQEEGEVLSTHVDDAILRGVSTAVLLRGCAAAFVKVSMPQDYQKSRPTDHLDDFISHDWEAERIWKFLALCLVYNAWPAAIASLAVGLLLTVLESQLWGGVLPVPKIGRGVTTGAGHTAQTGYWWCQAVCPCVFSFLFLYWQEVRGGLRLGNRLVFLDRYCIDQVDPARKAAGILGLGGFLRHSKRLVILWSPRFLTRLWCTYEVAAWLHLKKPMSSIEFMPLAHAKGVVIAGVKMWVGAWCFSIVTVAAGGEAVYLASAVAFLLLMPAAMHILRRVVHNLRELPRQLEGFTATAAGCFCCECEHSVPGRPDLVMLCDRDLVLRTLATWFLDDEGLAARGAGAPAHVDEFDRHIRETLGPWVLQQAGPTQVSYKYFVLCGLSWSWRSGDALASARDASAVAVQLHITLFVVPVCYKVGLSVAALMDARFGIPAARCHDALLTVGLTFILGVVALTMVLPTVALAGRHPWLTPIFTVTNAALTALAFRSELTHAIREVRSRCQSAAASDGELPLSSPGSPPSPPGCIAVAGEDLN